MKSSTNKVRKEAKNLLEPQLKLEYIIKLKKIQTEKFLTEYNFEKREDYFFGMDNYNVE